MRIVHAVPFVAILAAACGGASADTIPTKISDCPLVTMVVSPANVNLAVGDSAQLTAQPAGPPCGTPPPVPFVVFWRSSNPAVVAADSASGKIRGVGSGMGTVIATVIGAEGYKGASAITVSAR